MLIFGSESKGIEDSLLYLADYNIYIPSSQNQNINLVDSLNVGVSAGIIINNLKSQLL